MDFDETIHLERGQNLFEIHISKVSVVLPLRNRYQKCVQITPKPVKRVFIAALLDPQQRGARARKPKVTG